MIVKVSAGVILILILGVIGLQFDDELHPEATQWIESVNSPKTSESYFFLLGIFAAEGLSPFDVGRSIYESIKEGEEQYTAENKPFYYRAYPEEGKIELPEGNVFCLTRETECLQYLFEEKIEVQRELENHRVLFSRYHEFINLEGYNTLTRPMLTEPLPPFSYLSAGHRLNSLSEINRANNGEPAESVRRLISNFEKVRGVLQEQDTLIGKMVFLQMLSETLDIISILAQKNGLTLIEKMTYITKDERDLTASMARELSMGHGVYQGLDRNPGFWAVVGEEEGGALGWVVRAVFKPHMTLNADFPRYQRIAFASQLSQLEFADYVNKTERHDVDESFRNYAGAVLNNIAKPSMIKYVARFFDLNSKIELINNSMANRTGSDKFSGARNP